MNRIAFLLIGFLSLGIWFTGCKSDMTEEELLQKQLAQVDSLQKRGGVIKYTVKLISTANSAYLKSSLMSLKGGVVTIHQNDSSYTAATDSLGIAFFSNLRIGTAAVHVKLPGHAEVDYITDLTPNDTQGLTESQMVGLVRYVTTQVPMFPIEDPGCATITGKVTGELDLTNTTPEAVKGVKVTAIVDVNDSSFIRQYLKTDISTKPEPGRITSFAFSNASTTATTDSLGVYTLKVPAAVTGLPIKISVEDYQAEQTLYLENDPETGEFKPSVYYVPVCFSLSIAPTDIPEVKSLYAILDDPTCNTGIIYNTATFDFELDGNGTIKKVNIVSSGSFPTKPSLVVIDNQGEGAVLEPVFNVEKGMVDSVIIVNGGINYNKTTTIIRSYLVSSQIIATVKPEISKDGILSNIIIVNKGKGYIQEPNCTFYNLNRNAEMPKVKVTINPYTQQINRIYIENYGNGLIENSNYPAMSINAVIDNGIINCNSSILYNRDIYLGTGKVQY